MNFRISGCCILTIAQTTLSQHFEAPIQEAEWARLLRYAARVREIVYHTDWSMSDWHGEYFINDRAIHELYRRTDGRPLFPNLRYLAWHRDVEEAQELVEAQSRLLDILVSPTLTAVALWHPLFSPEGVKEHIRWEYMCMGGYDPDLKKVIKTCPDLKELLIGVDLGLSQLRELSTCTRLRTLHCQMANTTAEVLEVLGQNPHIEELRGAFDSDRHDNCTPWTSLIPRTFDRQLNKGLFPALRRIRFYDSYTFIPYLTDLLPSIGSNTLEEVSLSHTHAHTLPEHVGPFIEALCAPRYAHSLMTVDLSFTFYNAEMNFNSQHPIVAVSFHDTFSSLLQLRRLHTLSLSLSYLRLSVSDADLDLMARAWPDIVTLRLGHSSRNVWARTAEHARDTVRPTMPALVTLAERCTDLAYLQCDVVHVTEEDVRALGELCAARGWKGTGLVRGEQDLVKIKTDRGGAGKRRRSAPPSMS